MHEAIPGLAGEQTITKPVKEGTAYKLEKLKQMPFQTIYMQNLQLAVSKNFEDAFEEFLV